MVKTVRVEPQESLAYLRKARQFVDGSRVAAVAGRADAAMLCAIHAAISAADGVTVALAGLRSTDPNHLAAAELLRVAGRGAGDFETRARQFSALLQKKNLVEYEARNATVAEVEDAVKRAERLVEWAAEVVERGLGRS
jgi:hypothetical protein